MELTVKDVVVRTTFFSIFILLVFSVPAYGRSTLQETFCEIEVETLGTGPKSEAIQLSVAERNRRLNSEKKGLESGIRVIDRTRFGIQNENDIPNERRTIPSPFRSPRDVKNDGDSAFVIAGLNSTSKIRQATSINGIDFRSLTSSAVGTEGTTGNPRASEAGFILPGQTVKELLVKDNITVVETHGLTHQQVAEPLIIGIKALESTLRDLTPTQQGFGFLFGPAIPRVAVEYLFNGEIFIIEGHQMGGSNGYTSKTARSGWFEEGDTEGSFFGDELFANYEFVITRKRDGTRLAGDPLTALMINRYGFYQGGAYRIGPKRIIEFFGLRKG